MTGLADIASIVTSGATCVALVFAGLELRQSRARDRRNRQVEIEGVAVSWRPPEVPRGPQDPEGRSRWVLEFTAYNPGQLPVSDVQVAVRFALDVERVHHDGHVDQPTRTMVLETPVLAGGTERTWRWTRWRRSTTGTPTAALPTRTQTGGKWCSLPGSTARLPDSICRPPT